MKTARYWTSGADGLIECLLCPRHCRIADGGHGACLVRQRRGGQLIAASYGKICGLAVDPIEKKPLYHFLSGSFTLSFGTVGCNLFCPFCQNWSLSRAARVEGRDATPEEIAETALRLGCASVAFTYNEPAVFIEFAMDTAAVCRARGLKTVAVTNGWIEPEPRREFYAGMDAANVDLKAFTETFYRDLCRASLQPVLDTLVYLRRETSVHLEVTTLLIPNRNDSAEELDAMTRWAVQQLGADTPWHFSAYTPTARWREEPVTPLSTLRRAEQIARRNGLRNVHLGNVHLASGAGAD